MSALESLRADGVGSCRSCGAAVVWRRHHRTQNTAPLNLAPVVGGNIEVDHDGTYRIVSKLEREATPEKERFTNHFATCEFAGRHR